MCIYFHFLNYIFKISILFIDVYLQHAVGSTLNSVITLLGLEKRAINFTHLPSLAYCILIYASRVVVFFLAWLMVKKLPKSVHVFK